MTLGGDTLADPSPHETRRRDTRRALLTVVGSATMFGMMAFAAKIASARISGPQVAMIRFAVGLLAVLLFPASRRAAFVFKRIDLLLYRGIFGGISVLCYFLAIEHTKVGIATLLNYTSPIFSGIFSAIFLGEVLPAAVLLPLPVALTGIVLVVGGGTDANSLLHVGRWELVGVCSSILSGAAMTAIRAARREENSWAVFGSFCFLGLLTCMPMGLASWKTPTPREWVALAAMSVLAIGAQLAMTHSLKWLDAMTVGIISQLAVVVSMILGAIFLSEVITGRSALGSFLTIAGVLGVVTVTARKRAAAEEVAPEN